MFAFVLGFSFILLTLAFRSIVVPAKAILLNLLSVGAAYGLIVLVFQKGVGNELFGFPQVDAIEAWLPLFLFSVLFGLSMDYHVFLLSRIRERYTQTGDSSEAVSFGVRTTSRLITGAALIIIVVFVGFATGELVMFQQMGFGVAVALLLDATVIRSVLVPAAMELLGERNWYLPQLARVATALRGRGDELRDPAADRLALILLEEVAGAGDDLRLARAGNVRRDPLGHARREDRIGVGEEDERRPVPVRRAAPAPQDGPACRDGRARSAPARGRRGCPASTRAPARARCRPRPRPRSIGCTAEICTSRPGIISVPRRRTQSRKRSHSSEGGRPPPMPVFMITSLPIRSGRSTASRRPIGPPQSWTTTVASRRSSSSASRAIERTWKS